MSTRLQVVVDDAEMERFEQTANALGLTVSEWVRRSLRIAQSEVSTGKVDEKLRVIREAYAHQYPAPDIDQMLDEIERGYMSSVES
ncbi:MAG TPA: antitoxin [Chloroflexota bacterium]|jgi:hypothetical protein|nr:antitoxin [Chloroflexota bacterium]